MRKLLLKFALCLCPVLFASCSDEGVTTGETAEELTTSNKREAYWDGIWGIAKSDGTFELTLDPEQLKSDLERHMLLQGDTVSLKTIGIYRKTAANDLSDSAPMLIAADDNNISIGVMMNVTEQGNLKPAIETGFENPKSITCRGCATGCNLEYLNMPGGKVPYCNVNGCGDYCTQKEVEVN